MFPQRGILFPTDNMEYSMKPALNHMVDSIKLIWELADEQNASFVLAALGFMPSSTMSIDFLPFHVTVTPYKAQAQKVMLFVCVSGCRQGYTSLKFPKRSQKRPAGENKAKMGLMSIRRFVLFWKYHMPEYGTVTQACCTHSSGALSWPWHSESEWKPSC